MTMNADRTWIVERAKVIGFDLCGVVRPEKFPEFDNFGEWLERGYAGEMGYLADPRRAEPALMSPAAQSVIVGGLNYNTAHPYSIEAAGLLQEADSFPRGWISRYAWGDDYHEVMREKLNALVEALKEKYQEPFEARVYADTGPVSERIFAKHAGLGWLGKNTLLLNEAFGSWMFLGVVVTSLDLPPSLGPAESPPPDLCGNCRQCLDACPTEALTEPYVLDARKCISYLTIELRGSIPEELREGVGGQVYGCDICQDVCPYNRNAPVTSRRGFQPRGGREENSLLRPNLEWLAQMGEQEFRATFRKSAVKRTKWAGLVRNACIALGNVGPRMASASRPRTEAVLKQLAESTISTVSESAQWALQRIQQPPK
jgi:epoxyqueuosine reductase